MINLRLSPTSSSRRILVLEFVRRYFREHGASPSYGEIAAHMRVPRQRIGPIIEEWAAAGVLTVGGTPGRARSIVLTDRAANLSDSELELACHARGMRVTRSELPALVDAFPAVPVADGVTEYGLQLLRKLDDIP